MGARREFAKARPTRSAGAGRRSTRSSGTPSGARPTRPSRDRLDVAEQARARGPMTEARGARASGALVTLLCALTNHAAADVLPPEPEGCPPGSEAVALHDGSWCEPELPDDCPEGYLPRVVRDVSYCEPPPSTPCPTGSRATSLGPDRPFCLSLTPCADDPSVCGTFECRPTGICVADGLVPGPIRGEPVRDPRAHGACETDADCASGQRCDTTPRCDPGTHRVAPEGRALPAIIRTRAEPSWFWAWLPALAACVALLGAAAALGAALLRRRRE